MLTKPSKQFLIEGWQTQPMTTACIVLNKWMRPVLIST